MEDHPAMKPVIRSQQDVNDLINSERAKGGSSRAITFIALGGIFIDAYDFSSIAFGLKDIKSSFHLNPFQEGVVASSIMVGALFGALFGGYLVDRVGRYRMFMADMLFFVVAALGCALAPNYELLVGSRFAMGLGIGIDFPVALAFIAEFNALKRKGGQVTLWQPMWYLATGSSFLVLLPLYFVIPADHHDLLWRFAVGFGAVPALVVLLVRRRYMDESPSWAASQGELGKAADILRRSYGLDVDVDAPTSSPPRKRELSKAWAEYAQLFNRRYRRRTILAGTVGFCQSLEYYAVGFALPVIISSFLNQSRLTSIVGSLVFNLVFGVTGGFLGVYLSRRLGSWKLATSGFAVVLVALVTLALLGRPTDMVAVTISGMVLAVFVFFHAYGPGAQGATMATLSYPTALRGTGGGFGQAVLRVGSLLSLLWFPILSAEFGTGVYLIVAAAPLLGLLVLLAIRWEPMGVDVDAEADADARAAGTPTAGARRSNQTPLAEVALEPDTTKES